ncbi:MAG TPA: exodeoxyribonuclease VII small subunit [Candidatus Fraserbacteria bacterium]|nr:exodeoxyribonuclease VII small subunit [Candidatus Fraserbacteria bacterium]
MNIEGALARLEEIVQALEGEGTQLDESLKLFAEGVKLASAIKQRLEQSELKVRQVLEGAEGFNVEDFLA